MELVVAGALSFCLDLLLGDPGWIPHPVVWMGRAISGLEERLRRIFPKTTRGEWAAGALLAILLPAGTLALTFSVLWLAGQIHPGLRFFLEVFWGWQALAVRGLGKESSRVYRALREGTLEQAQQAVEEVNRYPDPLCRQLRACLGRYHDVSSAQILCGNGASDLIDRLVLALRPKRGMVTAPAFSEYGQALRRVGCQVEEFSLQRAEDFRVTARILERITPALDILFLCEPSNPAGQTTDRALLEKILERCDACGVLLVVDECFEEFLLDRSHSMVSNLTGHHLLILRAFTKFYGLAGVRLGYCLCQEETLLEQMRLAGQPWPVSHLAQAAGMAALEETVYGDQLRAWTRRRREALRLALTQLGCDVVPGQANYLLFFHRNSSLDQDLAQRGILIRNCETYSGLGPGWFRVAVREEEACRRLIQAMEECVG